jgi:hypothetical protein
MVTRARGAVAVGLLVLGGGIIIGAANVDTNRGGNEQKRTKSADALKERLRWRSWEEVQ